MLKRQNLQEIYAFTDDTFARAVEKGQRKNIMKPITDGTEATNHAGAFLCKKNLVY